MPPSPWTEDDAVPSLFSCSGAIPPVPGKDSGFAAGRCLGQGLAPKRRFSLAVGLAAGGSGGAEEIRTPDLRRAKAALSQLSYGPSGSGPAPEEPFAPQLRVQNGGPFWTRTRDLSLIRTAL